LDAIHVAASTHAEQQPNRESWYHAFDGSGLLAMGKRNHLVNLYSGIVAEEYIRAMLGFIHGGSDDGLAAVNNKESDA